MPIVVSSPIAVCNSLMQAVSRAESVEDVYNAAFDALEQGLGVRRVAICLFDTGGVMRFKAFRGLSENYRRVVERYSPFTREARDAKPVVISDVRRDPSLE